MVAAVTVVLLLAPLARGGWHAAWPTPAPLPPPALAALPPIVGTPMPGAADVRLVRALVGVVPSEAAVAVHIDSLTLADQRGLYLRYQLLALEYPRVVSVESRDVSAADPRRWHIIGPQVPRPDGMTAVATAGPYQLLRRAR